MSAILTRLALCLVALAVTCVAAAPAAAADEEARTCGPYTVTPAKVSINGILGNADSFSALFRVETSREDKTPVFLPAGDLTAPIGSLDESTITVGNPSAVLPVNEPRTISVSVKNVRFAGTYKGALELAKPHCLIPLEVTASSAPDLSLLGADKPISIDLVRCSHSTCWPGDWTQDVVTDLKRHDEVVVQVANAAQSTAIVSAIEVGLRSEPGERIPPAGAVQVPLSEPLQLNAEALTPLPAFNFKRDELEPGHYIGALYLTVEGAEKRTILPFDLDVKDGPWWAVLMLLVALLIQVLVAIAAWLKPRAKALRVLHQTWAKIPADERKILKARYAEARTLALEGKLTEAEEKRANVGTIGGELKMARDLETEAKKRSPNGKVPENIARLLDDLREAAAGGDAARVHGKRNEVRRAVEALSPAVTRLDMVRERFAVAGGSEAGVLEIASVANTVKGALQSVWSVIKRVVVPIGKGVLWLFTPLWLLLKWGALKLWHGLLWFGIFGLPVFLRALLVALFVLAGLKELYLNDTTFGAEPVLDYGALLLWGVAATAVNTALGKIIPSPS